MGQNIMGQNDLMGQDEIDSRRPYHLGGGQRERGGPGPAVGRRHVRVRRPARLGGYHAAGDVGAFPRDQGRRPSHWWFVRSFARSSYDRVYRVLYDKTVTSEWRS